MPIFEPGFRLCANNIYRIVEVLCFQWATCNWCSTSVTSWTCCNIFCKMFNIFSFKLLIAFVILTCIYDIVILNFGFLQQGTKRMPGIAVTKSVVATEPGGRRREEIFVDIIEKISLTFSSSVSTYLSYDFEFYIGLFFASSVLFHGYKSYAYGFQDFNWQNNFISWGTQ